MNLEENELYYFTLYSIVSKLKDQIQFHSNKIDYDNIELIVQSSKIEEIKKDDFTIAFQKQNGSFTLITNRSIGDEKRKQIIGIMENITELDLFASYHFSDMLDINIDHFLYDDSKLERNKRILIGFKDSNQVQNLTFNNNHNKSKR